MNKYNMKKRKINFELLGRLILLMEKKIKIKL